MTETETLSYKLTREEKGLSARLASLFSLRMFGIFIILPVFAVYTQELEQSTPFLSGLFIASYALTQIILQPLFGLVSDRFGRKPTIVVGLILFAIGSMMIAFTNDIYMAILGRVIQGSGAISAVVLAFASDLTRDAIRTKVMAIIGVSIGLTFGIAMFISPLVYGYSHYLGMSGGMGIFLLCTILAIAGIYVTIFHIPNAPKKEKVERSNSIISEIKASFKDRDICRLYFGGLMIHLLLTLLFTSFPFFLEKSGYGISRSWMIYLPSFFISIFIMIPSVGFAERYYQHRLLFLSAIAFLGIAIIMMMTDLNTLFLLTAMTLFFIGFNVLEATQPSLMSRFAPENSRGMIMGIFSSSQFLGASIGGMIGSLLRGYLSYKYVFIFAIILIIAWFILAYPMNNPIRKDDARAKV